MEIIECHGRNNDVILRMAQAIRGTVRIIASDMLSTGPAALRAPRAFPSTA